jgi:hypothetical protein
MRTRSWRGNHPTHPGRPAVPLPPEPMPPLRSGRSEYEQPFGTFAGELPGAGALREGWDVMERHDVRW